MAAITASRAESFPIGELAKRSGVKIETIRYYERAKMLAPPLRTPSGRRVYGVTDLRILVFIRLSRELGFSLDEIRALLRLGERKPLVVKSAKSPRIILTIFEQSSAI
jgi:MerR family mercuric resistance operon transcriptional regulator